VAHPIFRAPHLENAKTNQIPIPPHRYSWRIPSLPLAMLLTNANEIS